MWHALILAQGDADQVPLQSVVSQLHRRMEVQTVTGLGEALTAVRRQYIDIVAIATCTHFETGLQFVRSFRAMPGYDRTPVLMLVPRDLPLMRHQAMLCGATDTLLTPFDRVACSARLRQLFDLQRYREVGRRLSGRVQRRVLRRERSQPEMAVLDLLERLEAARCAMTFRHETRTALIARLLAEVMSLDREECDLIEQGAALHDIGKMGVSERILNKPGQFNPEERRIMLEHPRIGRDILLQMESPVLKMAAKVAYSHHERMDGSGYPQGLKGPQIPLSARIVAVADVIDSVSVPRPYKPAWAVDRALDYVKAHSGTLFDRFCVWALGQRWDEVVSIVSEPVTPT